jgi:gamma-butyrobetaine dioxygenase
MTPADDRVKETGSGLHRAVRAGILRAMDTVPTGANAPRSLDPLDRLAELFAGDGAQQYLGEPVTQAGHMLQTARLATLAGASDALVAAALLHDVGHFQGSASGTELMAGRDNHHSETGAAFLAAWFADDVTEPVRLHVAAKRYLCAREPGYHDRLSPASVFTLSVQGGPMTPAQADAFESDPWHVDAITLRRWDEEAKDPEVEVGGFERYRPLLERLLITR